MGRSGCGAWKVEDEEAEEEESISGGQFLWRFLPARPVQFLVCGTGVAILSRGLDISPSSTKLDGP